MLIRIALKITSWIYETWKNARTTEFQHFKTKDPKELQWNVFGGN